MRLLFFLFLLGVKLHSQPGVWYKNLDVALEHPDLVFQLQLKRKGLDAFPADLNKLPNLQKLDLSRNKIRVFPDSLKDLAQLIFLDLSRNHINQIPNSINQLKMLEYLDLWNNDIDALPDQMSQLCRLTYLDIRGVSMSHDNYNNYLEMMSGVEFYMSPPCNCKE